MRKQKVLSCVPSKPYLAFNQVLSGFQSGLTWNAVIIQQIVSFSPPLSVWLFPASGRGRLLTVKVWSPLSEGSGSRPFLWYESLAVDDSPSHGSPLFLYEPEVGQCKVSIQCILRLVDDCQVIASCFQRVLAIVALEPGLCVEGYRTPFSVRVE